MAWTSWQRRSSPGNQSLAFLMLALVAWTLPYAFFWLRLPGPTPFFWLDLTYLGVLGVPAALLAFALHFTGRGESITPRRVILMALPLLAVLILLWTDPQYHLFFGNVERSPEVGSIFEGGIGFYFNVVYSYSLVFLALYFLLRGYLQAKGLYRQQLAAILIGAFFPLLSNLVSVLGFNPFPALDLTPLAFTLTGGFFAFALHRLGLLDVVPVARYIVVEEMTDGVLVIDALNRVVDINPAAQELLGLEDKIPIGQPAFELLSPWPGIREGFRDRDNTQQELTVPGTPTRTVDLRISLLRSRGSAYQGRLVVIRDITDRIRIEKELRETNQRLQKQVAEVEKLQSKLREQAIRDSLTGVFNRRYLEESLTREIAQVKRDQSPLSLAMLDIDFFKSFNDTYGHAAGDRMLQALADNLSTNTRAGDIVCRYGGEEFVVVLPGAPLETALLRLEYCRQAFETLVLEHNGDRLQSTLSAGVASYPDHGQDAESLLAAADEAMYQAKQASRNQVMASV